MWIAFCVVAAILACICGWVSNKRANPSCEGGVLPPGSMGLPLIGETIELTTPSYSLDIHPFITRRVKRYGPIFRTSLAGQPFVVSVDPEFNKYIVQQEGKSVELWYLNTFSKLFSFEGESRLTKVGLIHKCMRRIIMNHFGSETLREKSLPHVEETVWKYLQKWSSQPPIEVKHAGSAMIFDLTAKLITSHDFESSSERMSEWFSKFFQGFMAFPLNVPGTTYHKCLKEHKKLTELLKGILRERMRSGGTLHNDFLDQAIDEMKGEAPLTEDAVIQLMFACLFASTESISNALILLLKMLSEDSSTVERLRDEHASILETREKCGKSTLSWEEYKSMTFTAQVINETLRLANVAPGIVRRAVQDIQVKGMTVPAGWSILMANSAIHLNPDLYACPFEFNPCRWKEIDSITMSKNFMPFGGGIRQCPGSDYTRVILSIFLHLLVTKFEWTKIRGGEVYRNPVLGFLGLHVKISAISINSKYNRCHV